MNLMLLCVRTAGLTVITVGCDRVVGSSALAVVGAGEAGLSVSGLGFGLTPRAPRVGGGRASVWELASTVIFRMLVSV